MKVIILLLCFITLVVYSQSAVTPDTEPPKFTFCPSDKVIETFDNRARVTWEEPRAVDNSGHPPSLLSNILKGTILQVGEYNIEYIARDDSFNTARCKFKVIVKQKFTQCPELHYPAHGALVCTGGPDTLNRLCKAVCQNGYNFASMPSLFYTCTQMGKWQTLYGNQVVPNCKAGGGSMAPFMHHYTGSAKDPSVQLGLKNHLKEFLKMMGFSCPNYCQQKLVVYPGSAGK